jgi:CRP-like cAMP-binding protein
VAISVDGRQVREEQAGESFGEIALLRSVPRTATVQAVEATEMVVLERGPFLEAITGQPASHELARAVADARLAGDPSLPIPVAAAVATEDEANAGA